MESYLKTTTGTGLLGIAISAVIVIAGCSSAASTSGAPTKTSAAATATAAAVTATPAATVAASADPAAGPTSIGKSGIMPYSWLVVSADKRIADDMVPTFEEIITDVDAEFSDYPELANELDQAAVDAALVKFAGKDKAAALSSGSAIFGALRNAFIKLEIPDNVMLGDILACGKANIPGWQAKLDADWANS
jgi:hypothetical protein